MAQRSDGREYSHIADVINHCVGLQTATARWLDDRAIDLAAQLIRPAVQRSSAAETSASSPDGIRPDIPTNADN